MHRCLAGGSPMTTSLPSHERAAPRVEATYTTPDIAPTRVAVFQALAPRTGECLADLGCGPGFMARELGIAVGSAGRVHAVDLSEPMLALARHRCVDLPWVEPVV